MIGSAAEVVAWIEANLPALDQDRFTPWVTEASAPGALSAHIHVRIQTSG
ncbi:hypothetical protein AB4305_03320 [Nocardia sp. 2YAB30]